jgi:GH15 family glucan-1,4-alpha-glucosidase
MYRVDGEVVQDEQELEHLSGYGGAQPVRVGNGAHLQEQNDLWGALLDAFHGHSKKRERLPNRVWQLATRQVEAALQHWREPDQGIWEVRGEPRHFTSSKLMCWVAADRGAKLAAARGDAARAAAWIQAAEEIAEDICERAVDGRNVFCQHYDTTALDASALLMPLVGFLPGDDPRIVATVEAIAAELTDEGLVLRYRPEVTDDGLGSPEGAFAICSFWLVSALVEIGEVGRASDLCEKLLSYANPLGLFAEEIDPRSGRQLGNFPQALTHLSLIDAVVRVIAATADSTATTPDDSPFYATAET